MLVLCTTPVHQPTFAYLLLNNTCHDLTPKTPLFHISGGGYQGAVVHRRTRRAKQMSQHQGSDRGLHVQARVRWATCLTSTLFKRKSHSLCLSVHLYVTGGSLSLSFFFSLSLSLSPLSPLSPSLPLLHVPHPRLSPYVSW